MLPLHTEAFGELLKETIRASEYFFDRVAELAEELEGEVVFEIPFEPDCNVVCLAMNPVENDSAAAMNEFVRSIYDQMRIDADEPIQTHAYFASSTAVDVDELSEPHLAELAGELRLEPGTLSSSPTDEREASDLLMLRNTLMNPWLRFEEEGRNYIDGYLESLEDRIRARLGAVSQDAVSQQE